MSRFVVVPSQYSIYELNEETFELLPTGMKTAPPMIVLEVMAMNGYAKRIGTVGTMSLEMVDTEESDGNEEGDEPDGGNIWLDE